MSAKDHGAYLLYQKDYYRRHCAQRIAAVTARRRQRRAEERQAELARLAELRAGPLADAWLARRVSYRLRKGERALLALFGWPRIRS